MAVAEEILERVPVEPGVYLFRDAAGAVVYVGKAKNLRSRVRQYFRPGGDERFFVAAGFLGRAVATIESLVVPSEKEALLLENHLIKQHQPRFNIKLRDDKQYLVLRLKAPSLDPAVAKREQFPRVEVVRNIRDDGARYFGPYHSATSARETLRVLNRNFQLRTCTDHVLETRGRTCLQYQIKRCPGPCAIAVDPAGYREQVDDVMMFLSGRDRELTTRLKARMAERSEAEDFEVAAHLRDQIAAVERTLARQHIVQEEPIDQDVWGLFRQGDVVDAAVMFIRAGKLVGRRVFTAREQELPDGEVLSDFVGQYYATGTFVPDEVVLPVSIEDATVVGDWLSSLRGRRVKVIEPQRGVRVRLVELAEKNAETAASSRRGGEAFAEAALAKVASRLGLRRLPRRIECYDIAHIQGRDTVAAMVTFIDGAPAKAFYRRFKIETSGNDDFASMYEVLSRRFGRAGTDAAWALPDLVVVDGGKGQLASAVAAMADRQVPLDGEAGVDVISLAKERELVAGDAPDRVYLRNVKDPVRLGPRSAELWILARLRDEAHRFANTFHRQRRTKHSLTSQLDGIPGIGAVRRRALLKHFGSVRGLREASEEEIAAAPGMSRGLAAQVKAALGPTGESGAGP